MDGLRRALVAAAMLLLSCASAMAQYPDRPIRLIVPFPPGGRTDVFARVLSISLASELGQQVIIDNKGGAGGNVGTDLVAKAKPDGYILLFGTAATHGISISLYKELPYHPVKDFELIALVGIVPMVHGLDSVDRVGADAAYGPSGHVRGPRVGPTIYGPSAAA